MENSARIYGTIFAPSLRTLFSSESPRWTSRIWATPTGPWVAARASPSPPSALQRAHALQKNWTAKKTYEFIRPNIRPQSVIPFCVLLVLTAHFFTYSSTRPLCSDLYSMALLVASLPASLQQYKLDKLANQRRVLLTPRHEYCILSKRHWPRCCRSAV